METSVFFLFCLLPGLSSGALLPRGLGLTTHYLDMTEQNGGTGFASLQKVRGSSLENLDYGYTLDLQGWKVVKVLLRHLPLAGSLHKLPLLLRVPSAWQLGSLCAFTYDPWSAECKEHPSRLPTAH